MDQVTDGFIFLLIYAFAFYKNTPRLCPKMYDYLAVVFSSSSFRSHPHFMQIVANRSQHDDVHTLAKVLSDLSIGRQQ